VLVLAPAAGATGTGTRTLSSRRGS